MSPVHMFTAADGARLAVWRWLLPDDERPHGGVMIVHGLGEHAGRYLHVAERLNHMGWQVWAYDHYGHGRSDGARGTLSHPDRLQTDLADLLDSLRGTLPAGAPLVLLGHSMGGLVAAHYVQRQIAREGADAAQRPRVDALMLSSPALAIRTNALQKLLLASMPHLAPNLGVGNGLDANRISHDPAVVAAYRADPLVHDRISGRLARFIADAGPEVVARAPGWKVPTLLMYAGSDLLVNPAGSRAFGAAAPSQVVRAQCYPDLYHEIFNEVESQPVFDLLHDWLIANRQKVPDGSATAKAIDYSLKRWAQLTHFVDDGDVPISNNWVENQIRPIALGRSNWLFAGSLRAGRRAAAVMSLLHSARINGHDPYAYFKDVLERLPTHPASRIDELLPHRWSAAS